MCEWVPYIPCVASFKILMLGSPLCIRKIAPLLRKHMGVRLYTTSSRVKYTEYMELCS